MSIVTKVQDLVSGRDRTETHSYECQRCERRYPVRYYSCPACGGYRVERTDWSIE